MEFLPAKCSVMRVATSKDPLMLSYKLKGHQLQAETTSKYLGVDLSNNLDWKPHIDRIVKKSNSMLGFLRRNLRIGSQETKQWHTRRWCALTWNTAPQCGTHTKKITFTNWKWFKDVRHDLLLKDSITPALSQTCLTTFNGKLLRPEGASYSLLCSTR